MMDIVSAICVHNEKTYYLSSNINKWLYVKYVNVSEYEYYNTHILKRDPVTITVIEV